MSLQVPVPGTPLDLTSLVPASPVPVPPSGEPSEYPAGSWNLVPAAERYARDVLDSLRREGETYWFTLGPGVMPDGATGQPVPGLIIVVYGRSPVIGQPPLAHGAFQVGFPTRREIESAVRGVVEMLRRDTSALTSGRP